MMIKVFKTDVKDQKKALEIKNSIYHNFGIRQVTFDLEDCDRVLRVEATQFTANEIINNLNNHGFSCEELF